MMKTNNEIKFGSLLSYFQMGINIVIGLLYTPLMIQQLGKSEYGLYNTVSSIISLLGILNLGFNSGYIRYYAKYKKNKQQDNIYRLNGLFFLIFLVIGLIAFTCGMFLSFNLNLVFKEGLTASEYSIARVLIILLTINLSVSFPMSVFSNIISANEKFVFLKSIGILRTVLGPLVTFPLLLMGFKSIAMVIVTLTVSIVTDLLYAYYVLFILKNKFIFNSFEKGLFKDLFIYTSFIAINIIIDQINWNIDKILLARYKGTTAVSIYSVGYSIYSYYMLFSISISGLFTPRVHSIINNTKKNLIEQKKQLSELFNKIGRIQYIVSGLILSGFIIFGKEFIRFWAGSEYGESYYVAILLLVSASIPLIQNVGIEIQRALNKHRFRSIVCAAMALLNLIISIFLCKLYGATGSAIGTAISLLLANSLIINIYYHKHCNIDIISFWKNIFRVSLGLILPVITGIVINKVFGDKNIVWFCLKILIYSTVYFISMWFISMNSYEKRLISKPYNWVLNKFFKG